MPEEKSIKQLNTVLQVRRQSHDGNVMNTSATCPRLLVVNNPELSDSPDFTLGAWAVKLRVKSGYYPDRECRAYDACVKGL